MYCENLLCHLRRIRKNQSFLLKSRLGRFSSTCFLLLGLVLSSPVKAKLGELPTEDAGTGAASTGGDDARVPDNINTHSFGVGLGETFLGGKFKDIGENKITLDLFYNYAASYSFDLLANGHYSEHSYAGQKVILRGLDLGAKGKFYQFDSFSPYALGGFGIYWPQVTRNINGAPLESETKATFGYHLGVGGDLHLNQHITFGALLQYHSPFTITHQPGGDVSGTYYKLMMLMFYTL